MYYNNKKILSISLGGSNSGGDKVTTTVNCKHRNEYTGYGQSDCNLTVGDQQMLITKIQGQTKTKSPNLFNQEEALVNIGLVKQSDGSYLCTSPSNIGSKKIWENKSGITGSLRIIYDVKGYRSGSTNAYVGLGIRVYYTDGSIANVFPAQNGLNNFYTYTTKTNASKTVESIRTVVPNGGYQTYYRNFAVYEDTSICYYLPYDSTLVNSNNNLISTGRNLIDWNKITKGIYLDYTNGNQVTLSTHAETDFIEVIGGATYDFRNSNGVATHICFYDKDKNYVSGALKLGNFTVPSGIRYIRVCVAQEDATIARLVYGNNELPYEHYIEDLFNVGIELGAYDYIDNVNGNVIKQTSSIITFKGTEAWSLGTTYTNVQRFDLTYDISNYARETNNRGVGVCNKCEWTDAKEFKDLNGYYITPQSGGAVVYVLVPISSGITTVDLFKQWLVKENLHFAYKLADPVVTNVKLPSGMAVYKGGLQKQDGTVPYNITKQYAISLSQQVLHNVEVDRTQQAQLDTQKEQIDTLLPLLDYDLRNCELVWNGGTTSVAISEFSKGNGLYLARTTSFDVLFWIFENYVQSTMVMSNDAEYYSIIRKAATGTISLTGYKTTGGIAGSVNINYIYKIKLG